MTRRLVLGLDAGGGLARALLLDLDSGDVVSRQRRLGPKAARQHGPWAMDLDLERLWRRICGATRDVLRAADAKATDIVGIAPTSARHTTIVLDSSGSLVLAAAGRDARAGSEARELARDWGPELLRRGGHWPTASLTGSRLRWMEEAGSRGLVPGDQVVTLSDWVSWRLCWRLAAERSQASESLLYDLASDSWADDLITGLGFPRSAFPELVDAGDRLGELAATAAAQLGLRPGIPVSAGGASSQSALLGAGLTEPGELGAAFDRTSALQLVLGEPRRDPAGRLWTARHVLAGRWVREANLGPSADALGWLADLLYPNAPDAIAALTADAGLEAPGAGALSTLAADLFSADDLALPVAAIAFSPVHARPAPDRRRMLARALVEGLAFGVRANAEALSKSTPDAHVLFMRVCGGLAASPAWGQALADATGRPVEVAGPAEAAALGAALCAGVGAGHIDDLAGAAAQYARVSQVHRPEPEAQGLLSEHYASWRALRERVASARSEVVAPLVHAILRDADSGTLRDPSDTATLTLDGADLAVITGDVDESPTTGAWRRVRPRLRLSGVIDDNSLRRLRRMVRLAIAPPASGSAKAVARTLASEGAGFEVLAVASEPIDLPLLRKLPDLRVLVVCEERLDHVDVAACTRLGVPVLWMPERSARARAEWALSSTLQMLRDAGDRAQAAGRGPSRRRELGALTVGVLGLGPSGLQATAMARSFGSRVLTHDARMDAGQVALAGGEPCALPDLLADADVIWVFDPAGRLPVRLDGPALAKAAKTAWIVSAAPASQVDLDSVLSALRSGGLVGATFDSESLPVDGKGLEDVPGLVIGQEPARHSQDVSRHQGANLVRQMEALLAGREPDHCANPETLGAFSWIGSSRGAVSSERIDAIQELDLDPK